MSIVIISKKDNQLAWRKALKDLMPELDIYIYPDDDRVEDVDMVLAWHPPDGVFKRYPNLKLIASTGAGVDHIIKDPDIPKHVSITKVVDDKLSEDMTAYLEAQVLCHLRDLSTYKLQQTKGQWQPKPYRSAADKSIGIMGMGALGIRAATKFVRLGFNVRGWAKSLKNIEGVACFYGSQQLDDFLSQTDILICLLPLTSATTNILSHKIFEKLPSGAFVINVARGEHLVEADLVEALDAGHLSGACLDVFRKEPLPSSHIFWSHPKIFITPHVASITSIRSVAPQIIDNYQRLISKRPLLNAISFEKGY